MECYASKVKSLGLLGLTILMVSVCYFSATLPQIDPFHRMLCWFVVGFFGLGFTTFPMMFFRAAPVIVINEEGIEDHRWNLGVIRWQEIRSVWLGSMKRARFLCLELRDQDKYLSRMPRWQRSL